MLFVKNVRIVSNRRSIRFTRIFATVPTKLNIRNRMESVNLTNYSKFKDTNR